MYIKPESRYALIENSEGSWELCKISAGDITPECVILVPAHGIDNRFLKRLFAAKQITIKKSDIINFTRRGKFLAQFRRQDITELPTGVKTNKRRRVVD
jgi:hypothetical protein